MRSKKCYLIENNMQTVYAFSSISEMRGWAKKNGLRLKDDWYYTESYVVLPTGELD